MIRPSVCRCHGCDSDKCQGTCKTAREDAGHGGFCLLPSPVKLGPVLICDRSNARPAIARNFLGWAQLHRNEAATSTNSLFTKAARRRMRAAAMFWRALR